jgi:hypothetical protein
MINARRIGLAVAMKYLLKLKAHLHLEKMMEVCRNVPKKLRM